MSIAFPAGKARLVLFPQRTRYEFGKIEEIAGSTLTVIEQNCTGDCLCYVEGKGIVDVHSDDVAEYTPDPLNALTNAM